MTHLYANQSAEVAHRQRRRIITAEINLLRKFEGKQLIEERVDRLISKAHSLWFGPKPAQRIERSPLLDGS